jgi:very-short-patch-repair endonuclease
VRGERNLSRRMWRGVPTTTVPQIVLDLAATGDVELVRFAIAQMDFMRILNVRALQRMCRSGVAGSAVLKEALGRPQPLFAKARSPFEVGLVQVCEQTGIRVPDDVNEEINGITVDAVWWDEMVVVECDGKDNHDTWRQRRRDAGTDMTLRGLGFLVIRYTSDKLDDPWAVHADLNRQLEERRGRAAGRAGR